MSKEEMVEAILTMQADMNTFRNIIADLGYDTKDGKFNGIIYDQSTEEVRDYITNNNANRWYYTEHDWKTIRRELKAELRKA
jgi:hypothetical protein